MKYNKSKFQSVFIYLIGFVIIASFIVVSCSKQDDEYPGLEDPDPPIIEEADQSCASGNLFSRAPINIEDVTSMGVLGSLIPPGHTFPTPHLYMYVLDQNTTIDNPANIYASANMTLKTIVLKYYETMGNKTNYTDYDLHFSICDDVDMYFIHVRSLTHPKLIEALANASCPTEGSGRSYQECHINVDIDINVNEIIGTTGDIDGGVYGLDVGIRDYRLEGGRSDYANPDRWCTASITHPNQRCFTACFFDYLDPTITSSYLDLFLMSGNEDIQRTATPICGTTYTDIINTAQGYWFPNEGGETYSETNSLYLGPHDYLTEFYAISTGEGIPNLDSWVYSYTPESSGQVNRKFGEISDTQIYAFKDLYNAISALQQGLPYTMNFSILMQLSEDWLSLIVEKQTTISNDPSVWAFTSNAVTFYR